jgi:cytochrome c-type biogenesis protein
MIDLILIVLSSGLLAGMSTCILPTYPVMLNSLTRTKENPKLVVISFVLGLILTFTLVYVILGAIISLFGGNLAEDIDARRGILFLFAGIVCILFAIQILGKFNFFTRTISIFRSVEHTGVLGSFITGMFFGTVISPCSAPFLVTGIVPVLAAKTTVFEGILLMGLFAVSMSLPLLILGLFSGHAIKFNKFFQNNIRNIEILSAIFLVIVGIYFITLA